ncbi:MAG: hypothetical protein IPN10_00120 [Saprospiraceae bacterium]|nr:hypothetical protein [Saprospiraceae bacterium]
MTVQEHGHLGVRPGDPVISNINDPNAVVSGFPAPGSTNCIIPVLTAKMRL